MNKAKFKVGDRVKVVNKITDHASIFWLKEMDALIGTEDIISKADSGDSTVKLTDYWVPADMLELIPEGNTMQENLIDINKTYRTRDGRKVEILKIMAIPDANLDKVVGIIYNLDGYWQLDTWRECGNYLGSSLGDCSLTRSSGRDLIEVQSYADFQIDDKVLVWDDTGTDIQKVKGYFAGVSVEGRPMTFVNGATSFSAVEYDEQTKWDNCIKYEE